MKQKWQTLGPEMLRSIKKAHDTLDGLPTASDVKDIIKDFKQIISKAKNPTEEPKDARNVPFTI